MSTTTTARPHDLPHVMAGSASLGWWGTVMLLFTEATLFGGLISAYFYLRFLSPAWPPDGLPKPELILPAVGSVLLLGSSLPMYLAERAGRRDHRRGVQAWLLVAFVLGVAFLGIQGAEYARSEFTPQTNAYGSLFFTITGIHGLHVLGALLLNLGMQAIAARRRGTRADAPLRNVALYWHFVDAVWVVIFASLYLSPYAT